MPVDQLVRFLWRRKILRQALVKPLLLISSIFGTAVSDLNLRWWLMIVVGVTCAELV
jgi:hypothetical protein